MFGQPGLCFSCCRFPGNIRLFVGVILKVIQLDVDVMGRLQSVGQVTIGPTARDVAWNLNPNPRLKVSDQLPAIGSNAPHGVVVAVIGLFEKYFCMPLCCRGSERQQRGPVQVCGRCGAGKVNQCGQYVQDACHTQWRGATGEGGSWQSSDD